MNAEENAGSPAEGAREREGTKTSPALPRTRQFGSLWWQTALLLSPVVLLALLGFRWLKFDRSVAQEQARQTARWLAQSTGDRLKGLGAVLGDAYAGTAGTQSTGSTVTSWTVNGRGDLLSPPVYDANPRPFPLNLGVLPPDQMRLYEQGSQGEFNIAMRPKAIEAWQKLCEVGSPERLVPVVRYRLGTLLMKDGKLSEAMQCFAWVVEHAPRTLGESGLPLLPLAQWQQLEIMHRMYPVNPADPEKVALLCSNLVTHPSCLTERLLTEVSRLQTVQDVVHPWIAVWQRDEAARRLYFAMSSASARGASETPWKWVELEIPWLVYRGGESNRTFQAANLAIVKARVEQLLGDSSALASYMGLEVRVAGRSILAPTNSSDVLEVSTQSGSADGSTAPVAVAIHLTNPAKLYQTQRTRSQWLLGIILLASVGAILGTVALRRAYLKQLALTELKGNFVASVSHELRAPIASIRLLAEGLERGKVTEEARRATYFRLIVQECRRLSSLIENVLDLSRIDQGRKRYEFDAVDLDALIRHTVQVMEPYAQERQVRLSIEPAVGCPVLEADGRALQQALVNLMDNAIKHTPAEAPVTVGWREMPAAQPGDPAFCEIWVQDQGPGIPAAQHQKIFEPFYRRGSELRRETAGIGIGLTIVKHVVDAHRGTIRVESEPRKGARFLLRLPAKAHLHECSPEGS